MCHSKESSLNSYIIVSALSCILYILGDKYDKYIAIFYLALIQMQLPEYLMWSDQKCGTMNKFATILAYITLIFVPSSLLLAGYYLKTISLGKKYVFLFSTIIVLSWSVGLIQYITTSKDMCSNPNSKGHLVWDFIEKQHSMFSVVWVLYFVFLLLPFFFLTHSAKKIFMLFLIIASIITHASMDKSWYSLWCYSIKHGIIYYIIFSSLYYMITH
jgi:hypothetical protein